MRLFTLCCLALVAPGCGSKPTVPDTMRTAPFDGKYEFEVEKVEGTTALKSSRSDDGAGKVEELIDYEIGRHRIKVVNGALTLDGKDCGRLEKGDKVRFAADGKLYVNGVERGVP
jgi:hypothetical protein